MGWEEKATERPTKMGRDSAARSWAPVVNICAQTRARLERYRRTRCELLFKRELSRVSHQATNFGSKVRANRDIEMDDEPR